jgi:hypothetical protein
MSRSDLQPCPDCAPNEGLGKIEERFSEMLGYSVSKLVPCTCAYAEDRLAKQQQARAQIENPGEPVLSTEDVTVFVEMLSDIPYFRNESGFRIGVGDEIRSMCRDRDEALWLVKRMVRLGYPKWPGVAEMRRVYCARRVPLDGVKAIGDSEFFPDGIPRELPQAQAMKALPPGKRDTTVSADRQIQTAVQMIGESHRLLPPSKPMPQQAPTPKIAETREQKHFKPITRQDVDRAVAEHRASRRAQQETELDQAAREEVGLER